MREPAHDDLNLPALTPTQNASLEALIALPNSIRPYLEKRMGLEFCPTVFLNICLECTAWWDARLEETCTEKDHHYVTLAFFQPVPMCTSEGEHHAGPCENCFGLYLAAIEEIFIAYLAQLEGLVRGYLDQPTLGASPASTPDTALQSTGGYTVGDVGTDDMAGHREGDSGNDSA